MKIVFLSKPPRKPLEELLETDGIGHDNHYSASIQGGTWVTCASSTRYTPKHEGEKYWLWEYEGATNSFQVAEFLPPVIKEHVEPLVVAGSYGYTYGYRSLAEYRKRKSDACIGYAIRERMLDIVDARFSTGPWISADVALHWASTGKHIELAPYCPKIEKHLFGFRPCNWDGFDLETVSKALYHMKFLADADETEAEERKPKIRDEEIRTGARALVKSLFACFDSPLAKDRSLPQEINNNPLQKALYFFDQACLVDEAIGGVFELGAREKAESKLLHWGSIAKSVRWDLLNEPQNREELRTLLLV